MSFYRQKHNVQFLVRVRDRIYSKCVGSDTGSGCFLWQGCTQNGYGKLSVVDPETGYPMTLKVHRAIYFIVNNLEYLSEDDCISHLCGIKNCVKSSHLIIEPIVVNVQRNNCFEQKKCFGHINSPNCIIEK